MPPIAAAPPPDPSSSRGADDNRPAPRARRTPWQAASRPSVPFPEPPLSSELQIDLPAGARWALVLSHDVDHLGFREHLVDGFLLRYTAGILRREIVVRRRPARALHELAGVALAVLGRDRWDVAGALADAEKRAGVKSTWFVAVRRGSGINYRPEAARALCRWLVAEGIEVGLHSQCPDDAAGLAGEVADLADQLGVAVDGVRMHYLRLSSAALDGMARGGLRYDTTVFERKDMHPSTLPLPGPRVVRPGLLEIPMHVMDSTLFAAGGLGLDLDEAREYTRLLFEHAAAEGRTVVVNLHPNSYSCQTPDIAAWYDDLLARATSRSDVFLTDFRGLLPRVVMP